MGKQTKISNAVIKRLPRYRRYLNELRKKGVDKISSSEFSHLIGYTASQIRQDLNNFGGFGQQGYGYSVEGLYNEISTYYYKTGFIVTGIFEVDPKLIGTKINGVEVMDYENIVEFVEQESIDIGVICTTKDVAQEVADKLCFAGVDGLWNFAPVDIETPSHVAVENVHISDSLHSLAYHMNKKNRDK